MCAELGEKWGEECQSCWLFLHLEPGRLLFLSPFLRGVEWRKESPVRHPPPFFAAVWFALGLMATGTVATIFAA